MRRTLLLVLACSVLVGCWGGDEPSGEPTGTVGTGPAETSTEGTTEPAVEPVELVLMPPQALRRCRRFDELAEVCPRLVPEGRFGPGSGAYQASSSARFPVPEAWTFNFEQGGEDPRQPERNRPPALVHLVVTAAPPLRTTVPRGTELRDGLMDERRRRPLYLGEATWGGHNGVLSLALPYPLGGLQSNHLIFSWAAGSKGVSLHGWEPFTEVPAVLQAVVESIPPSR